ncbi:class I SAM-dependent methyltransferase [Methanoregula sp.]|uniref:class I SAM-dependent methyltransferase n=1 Tax=Methanoregula sp. TaxID=2052170 RepID=UPI00237069DB|nr:class I SAM-dependent methyltransferase [Methanoregula sp.]MDD1687887.1 class I SAM-dependent methyltransferase [Methanoregula sp.]
MIETSDLFWKSEEDAWQYDEYARATFARIYPVIADQILERTRITRGTCLDVGSGPGLLAIALSLLSDLRVTALDSSQEMYELACRNIRDRCMEDLVVPVIGDVHAIPAGDASFSLVVSRGSYHSWDNLPATFQEIYRVLRTEGMAYIGGGYGSARIREEVLAHLRERGIADYAARPPGTRFRKISVREIQTSVECVGISDYRIIDDDSGFWIMFRKNREHLFPGSSAVVKTGRENLPQFHDGFFFPK